MFRIRARLIRWLVFATVWMFAVAAGAGELEGGNSSASGVLIHTFRVPATALVDDFSRAIPSCLSMNVFWERGNSGGATLYPADSDDDTAAEIKANTAIKAYTVSERYGPFTPSKRYVRFVVDAVNATVPSTAVVVCSNVAGSGGVQVVTQAALASAGVQSTIYQVTDATTGSDCATGTPGATVAYCGWNGSAYVAVGIAGGVDNLGNHTATTTLEMASNPLSNVGDTTLKGSTAATPQPSVATVASPNHHVRNNYKNWFKIDGIKAPVQGGSQTVTQAFLAGAGTLDVIYTVTDATTTTDCATGTPGITTAYCIWNGSAYVAIDGPISKTKTAAWETEFVNLTNSEGYGEYDSAYGGGDTDLISKNYDVFGTGGSQANSDEGYQIIRAFIQDSWLTAIGTVSATVTSGAGTQTVAIANISEFESKMLGENKWAVFTELAVTVGISDVPPGVMNSAGVIEDAGWSGTVKGTQGQFLMTTGSAASVAGLANTGWCFASTDSTYNDLNGTPTLVWLPIVNVSGETVTTRWQNQGFDAGTPYQYIASEAAGEAKIAPCARVDQPNFTTGSDFIADTLTLVKGAGFPGAGSSAANDEITVAAYPGIRQTGTTMIMANKLGWMYPVDAFKALNLIDGTNLSGRFQLGTAFNATHAGAITNLVDGRKHAWQYGVACDAETACETGFKYTFPDTNLYAGQFALLNLGPTVASTYTHNVLRVEDYYEESLAFDHDSGGWGQGIGTFSRFLKLSDIGVSVGNINKVGGCTTGECFASSQGNADAAGIFSQNNFNFYLDEDGTATNSFNIVDNSLTNLFKVSESGAVTIGFGELFADRFGIEFETGDVLTDCSAFSATGGGIYYDDSEGKFKKCQDNVLSDLDTSAGSPAFSTVSGDTNTTSAFVVGSGASMRPSGSGVIEASEVDVAAGGAVTANGQMQYDSTANDLEYGDNGTNRKVANLDEAQAFTNKTIDVEATGNSITTVDRTWFPAAGCNNATATPFYDLPTSAAAVAACVTGTNTQKGVLDFDPDKVQSGQVTQLLPSDWTGSIDVKIKWLAAATTNNVIWNVATSCVADAETDDPAFNAASAVTDAVKGTTLQTNDATITGLTTTGCAAGELMHVKVSRDATNGSDTMTGNARLIGFELSMRRTQ